MQTAQVLWISHTEVHKQVYSPVYRYTPRTHMFCSHFQLFDISMSSAMHTDTHRKPHVNIKTDHVHPNSLLTAIYV